MLKRFSNQQLEKLLLHTVGINNILAEALLTSQEEECSFKEETIPEVNVDILVVDPNKGKPEKPEQPPKVDEDLEPLCGKWRGVNKKVEMMIFKAAPGYMIAFSKKFKTNNYEDCFLIHDYRGKLCFNAGEGAVYLSFDERDDSIMLYPGGEFTRIEDEKK